MIFLTGFLSPVSVENFIHVISINQLIDIHRAVKATHDDAPDNTVSSI